MRSNIGKNFIYQLCYQIVSYIVPLVTAPYISRVFGASLLGEYTYTNTIAYYFYIICMLGIETYGARIISSAQDDVKKRSVIFFEVYTVQILMAILGSLLYITYFLLISIDHKVLLSIQIMYVASSIFYIPWFFVGIEDFKNVAIRNVLLKVGTAISIFVFVHEKSDLIVYTIIMSASFLISNIVFWVQIKNKVLFVKVNIIKAVKKHFKSIVLLFVPQIGITLFMYMDKIMLGMWSPFSELGLYQNAEKIINIPIALIMSFGAVIMPRAANMYSKGMKNELVKLNTISTSVFLIVSVGCMFGLAAIANDFAPWFFGKEFEDCSILIVSLSVTVLLMGLENALQKQYLVPIGKDRFVALCMLMASVVNFVIDALLIPHLGAFGAIIGSIAAHVFICIIESIYVYNNLPIGRYYKNMIWYLLVGFIMYLGVRAIALIPMSILLIKILIEIVSGMVIYILLMIMLLRINATEEHKIILDTFRIRNK